MIRRRSRLWWPNSRRSRANDMLAGTKNTNIYEEVLAHFLTDFPVNQPPRELGLYVTQFLRSTYSSTVVDDFLAQSLGRLQDDLVTEYNERSSAAAGLRY